MKSFLLLLKRMRWLPCSVLCRDHFFNRDASLEIDRLVVENETLKATLRATGLGG